MGQKLNLSKLLLRMQLRKYTLKLKAKFYKHYRVSSLATPKNVSMYWCKIVGLVFYSHSYTNTFQSPCNTFKHIRKEKNEFTSIYYTHIWNLQYQGNKRIQYLHTHTQIQKNRNFSFSIGMIGKVMRTQLIFHTLVFIW